MQAPHLALKSDAGALERDGVPSRRMGINQTSIRRGRGLLDLPLHYQTLSPAFSLGRLSPRTREHLFHLLPPAVTLAKPTYQLTLHLEQIHQIVEADERILSKDCRQHLRVVILHGCVADVGEVTHLVNHGSDR